MCFVAADVLLVERSCVLYCEDQVDRGQTLLKQLPFIPVHVVAKEGELNLREQFSD